MREMADERSDADGAHADEGEMAQWRARTIDATPGPAELFHIVNDVIAEHLGAHPLVLSDLAAIAAEKL